MASSNAAKRIVFTGGSGKAGRHCIPYLLSKGHSVLNVDLAPLPHPTVHTLKADLTDSGQVFNALSSHFHLTHYENPRGPGGVGVEKPDAVIHFAAYARNLLVPDSECFRGNVLSTYNVIEAACKLGIKKVIIASSETTYGVCFAQGDTDYHSFPLEEDYDNDPEDTFPGTDIYALRIGNVIEPHEYESDFPGYVSKPETRKRNAWSYIDARDLGQICDLCVQKNGLGFQVFNATNDTITTKESTAEILKKYAPNTPITREMGEFEAPLSNRKIREVLGFKDVHNWRKYIGI
ncbi:MAG: hypothetical protein Q9169_000761 [Polycauliona sp. 2 TL-2023]